MKDTRWTNEQWEAISERDCNLLVAAAAGAGKTAVLVERIIRKITDETNPTDIDKLLVVTFTNAAAAEMRERIAEAISVRIEEDPDADRIRRQLTLLTKASITTIHSFCLEVIRSNFHSISIDPGFRITDETEAALMKMEVLGELFEELYEQEGNGCFFSLLECYGGNRDDQALQDMVLGLYNFIQSSPEPGEWLIAMSEHFNQTAQEDFSRTSWGETVLQTVEVELLGLKAMMEKAIRIIRDEPGLDKYLMVYEEDLANIRALEEICSQGGRTNRWDDLFDALDTIAFNRLPPVKEADKIKQDYVKEIRDNTKKRLSDIREKSIAVGSQEIFQDLRALYPLMQYLVKLVQDFGDRYKEKKNKKSVVDFNDLEHFCLQILSERDEDGKLIPSKTALAYKRHFAEILVDEYQDSNMVQEIIINLISREDTAAPNVFMVGDVKQSIYRFRQAKPELFLSKYNSYPATKGERFRKIILSKNFRSRKQVVDAVNYLFQQIMSQRVGELDYTDEEALNPGAVFSENADEHLKVGGASEFHLIETSIKGSDGFNAQDDNINESENGFASGDEEGETEAGEGPVLDEEMLDTIQCEARLAAKRILTLMEPDEEGKLFAVFDKNRQGYRPVEYRNIVILLRTTKNWAEIYKEELTAQGIPVFADTGTGFFKTSEVQVMLSLLQVIDNPRQDIPLLAVLRSPIVSFSIDELAQLRLVDKKIPLYDALLILARDTINSGEASAKASAFLERLQCWREMSQYISTDRLLWYLYMETGYYGIVGAMPAGQQRQANLRILFERARQFEETSYKGLFNFINFIDKLKSSRGDMGSARILGENDNVVRIMSIHKSKGLEFPVVILAGCGKRFNLQDMNKNILFHQELGLGPDVVDHNLRLSYPSTPKQAIRHKIKAETLSEEMRILYVALTRAKEKLIITGAVGNTTKALEKWGKSSQVEGDTLPPYEVLSGSKYLDWIVPALLRHRNCGSLRASAGLYGMNQKYLEDHPSGWDTRIWSRKDILLTNAGEGEESFEFSSDSSDSMGRTDINRELSLEIERRLGWEYPYTRMSTVPAKLSVTELKRRLEREYLQDAGTFETMVPAGDLTYMIKKPLFLEEKKGLSAAEKGTVLHFVMQHLDLTADLESQIKTMVAKDLLTSQQAESVDIDSIRRFLNSFLGERLMTADNVRREVRFNLEVPCGEIYKDIGGAVCRQETILLQGIIDCYFEEDDGLVLIDYKTDYVPVGRSQDIKDKYRVQIEYYTRALERLTARKVKEKYVYLFYNGEILQY